MQGHLKENRCQSPSKRIFSIKKASFGSLSLILFSLLIIITEKNTIDKDKTMCYHIYAN